MSHQKRPETYALGKDDILVQTHIHLLRLPSQSKPKNDLEYYQQSNLHHELRQSRQQRYPNHLLVWKYESHNFFYERLNVQPRPQVELVELK